MKRRLNRGEMRELRKSLKKKVAEIEKKFFLVKI